MNSSVFKSKHIDGILDHKYKLQQTKTRVLWGVVNVVMTVVLALDLRDGSFSKFLLAISPLLWYLECLLLVIFSINVLFDAGNYIWLLFCSSPCVVPAQLRRLLGISESDERFCSPSANGNDLTAKDSSLNQEKNMDLSNFFYSSTPDRSATASRIWSSTPSNHFNSSSLSSFNQSLTSPLDSTSASSWTYFDGDISTRLQRSSLSNSKLPLDMESVVSDENSLRRCIRDMEETESRLVGGYLTDISSPSTPSSRWSANATYGSDTSPIHNKLTYQLSTRTPQSSAQRTMDSDSVTLEQEVWSRVGVLPETVFAWTENLRKWFGKTVLSRLVAEIDKVNEAFRWQGMADVQIGDVGLNVLRQRAKGPHLSSMYAILQYLEVTQNQEYLVQRLKELDKGGCMSEFRWNSGGLFKGKPWGDHLPTDSAIVFHMFCVYLDSRLPLYSGFLDGKPFTTKYFCKTPDQPDLKRKEGLCFYQSSINPPHFKLVVGDEIWEMHKGRNNLFHVILLFLHLLRTKEDGMLDRINLSPSGLNMLWIIE